jgi:amidase
MIRLYADSDALALGDLVRRRQISAAELVETAAVVIDRLNPRLNAVIHKLYDMGRAAATQVPADAPFAGVPFLLKELGSMWEGAPLTNSCAWMKDLKATSDWEVIRRIKVAGFLLVGKSNAPENGWAITTEPKLYGVTHNPWRDDVTAGGSSGGAGSAVASGMVPLAEGSDGAGSIRVPASCNGVVGLKPARGRITLAPLFVDFWHGGAYFFCLSRSVRDTAAYLDAVAGRVPGDPYTPATPAEPWLSLAARPPSALRVGFTITPPDGSPIDPEVEATVRQTARKLEELGHAVEEYNLQYDVSEAWLAYTRMTTARTAAMCEQLAPLVGRPVTQSDVEPLTWAVVQRGRSLTGVQLQMDIDAVRQFARQLVTELLPYDVYMTPTLTQKPRPLGYWNMSETDLDRYNAKWTDAVFMAPFNYSGLPAMSLPLGWSADGLPIGVQLVGHESDEATLLSLATVLEKEMPWRDRRPPVLA